MTRTFRPENVRLIGDTPTVLVNRVGDDFSCVYVDDRQAGCDVARILLSRGHRKIAFLGDPERSVAVAARVMGLQDALSAANLSEAPVVPCELSEAGGYEGVERLLQEHRAATAIFAACDAIAHGALRRLKEVGIKVPDDLSIVGFDDDTVSAYVDPPLTTVALPLRQLGNLAAKVLQELINTPQIGHARIRLKHRLVIRASVKER